MDNYIVINGKKTELTDEQLEKLGIRVEKKNPFARRIDGREYYYISARGVIEFETEDADCVDMMLYNNANYFNDKDFAKQVALHQLLYRKLLKYACEHDAADCDWNDDTTTKYFITGIQAEDAFRVECAWVWKSNFVYFNSTDVAEAAIKDIIRPFMEEHPEFVW